MESSSQVYPMVELNCLARASFLGELGLIRIQKRVCNNGVQFSMVSAHWYGDCAEPQQAYEDLSMDSEFCFTISSLQTPNMNTKYEHLSAITKRSVIRVGWYCKEYRNKK